MLHISKRFDWIIKKLFNNAEIKWKAGQLVDNIQEETFKKSSDRNNVTMKKLCVAQSPMFKKAEEA